MQVKITIDFFVFRYFTNIMFIKIFAEFSENQTVDHLTVCLTKRKKNTFTVFSLTSQRQVVSQTGGKEC